MFVPAGSLTKRVTIQQFSEGAADSRGQKAKTWTELVRGWAKIEPLESVRTAEVARQLYSLATHRITVRYQTGQDVTIDMRVVMGSRTFHIGHVFNPAESDEVIVMLVSEVL